MKKEIVDNKTGVPLEHYRKVYRECDPNEASRRSAVPYSEEQTAFKLTLLGRDVQLMHPELELRAADNGEVLAPNATILITRLVLEGKLEPFGGAYLAYNEMPWGDLYNSNFKGRCILRLAYGFGADLAKFEKACKALGAVPANVGDCSFDVEFIQGLYVRLILWAGDEEFPPSAQILFSDNFPAAWGAEDMAVVGDILIDALKKIK